MSQKYPAIISLIATVAIPSLGIAYGAQSMAAGAMIVAVLAILLSMRRPVKIFNAKISWSISLLFFIVLLVVLLSGIQSFYNYSEFNYVRFIQAYIFLILFMMGALCWSYLFIGRSNEQTDKAIKVTFSFFLICGFVSITGYSPFFIDASKPVIFFAEPSHYAVNLSPFFLYMIVMSQPKKRYLLILLALILALLLENLTLVAIVILVSALTLSINMLVIGLIFIIAVFFFGFDVKDLSYYVSRVDLSLANNNLSALSYLNGWERAYLNTINTLGLGIGFQQMGFVGNENVGGVMLKLTSLGVPYLNLKGGGFLASKLISEFGAMAIILLTVYLLYFFHYAKWLRNIAVRKVKSFSPQNIFFISSFVMYFVQIFFRGTGYFTSGAFLFLVSIFGLLISAQAIKKLHK